MTKLDDLDIQGNVLHPYRDADDVYLSHAAYVFLRVNDRGGAAEWLATLPVSTDRDAVEPLSGALNVAFTWRGLKALGQPVERFAEFQSFRRGMREPEVPPEDDPEHPWVEKWRASQEQRHILVTLYRTSAEDRDQALDECLEKLTSKHLECACVERGSRLPSGREHFGFVDGLSQPAVEGTGRGTPHAKGGGALRGAWYDRFASALFQGRWPRWRRLKTGEFVLGYPDEEGVYPPAPEVVGANGTFMVWWRLAQNVPVFREITRKLSKFEAQDASEEQSGDPPFPEAAAKLIGRHPSGGALARRVHVSNEDPESNDFLYADDLEGRCPLGAHIRRANPRDALGFGTKLTQRHRIIRRGLPYGPALAEGNEVSARGLVFACFNASLERQFEIVKGWCEDGNLFRLGHDRDVLAPGNEGPLTFRVTGQAPVFLSERQPVRNTGGEYLFVPGIAALRQIIADARRGAAKT